MATSSGGSLVEKAGAVRVCGLPALRRFPPHPFRFAFFIISRPQTPKAFRLGLFGLAADRSAQLPVYSRDPFVALRYLINPLSTTALSTVPPMHIYRCAGRLATPLKPRPFLSPHSGLDA